MNSKIFTIGFILSVILSFTSCSLDDIKPINQLTEENVITNEASANAVLNRIYNRYRDFSFTSLIAATGYYGVSQDIIYGVYGDTGFSSNNPQDDSALLTSNYTTFYTIINDANFFIELIEAGNAVGLDETRKKEMIAEARFLRAMSHLYALRIFGQFYDINSTYGVVTSLKPIRTADDLLPRSSVQETYDAIIADLQFAAENAGSGRSHVYVSATTARGLLAKAQLYAGDYTNAAANALETINNNEGFALETAGYSEIFNMRWESSEVLFAPFVNGFDEVDANTGFQLNSNSTSTPSAFFKTAADLSDGMQDAEDESGSPASGYDPRFLFTYGFYEGGSSPNGNGKYPFLNYSPNADQGNTFYFLRMAEVYLIYAEAEARRSGGDLNAALEKLNTVRDRAGVPAKSLTDVDTLLEDIFNEKMIELCSENTETYYDLIRYHQLGDIDATSLKSTLTEDKFIFPIPVSALAGNPSLVQNP